MDPNNDPRRPSLEFPSMADTVSNSNISSKRSGERNQTSVADKKKLKVLKQALKDERNDKQQLNDQIATLTLRNKELAKENESISTKYLSLYDENDRLQEYLQTLQYKIQNGTANKVCSLLQVTNFINYLEHFRRNGRRTKTPGMDKEGR